MSPEEVAALGPMLAEFLEEFADCFGRSEPRANLSVYVRGQLSDLDRKSVEPMALAAGVPPRTLQFFLSSADWDHAKLRDRLQQVVARDHGAAQAIAIVDETSHAKKGDKTPGVKRQYCGSRGKVDNCVVTVHLGYVVPATGLRCLLDSDLFLPEGDWDNPRRREAAGIPDEVTYRPKYEIAFEQLTRAKGNGVPFGWVTADEYYGSKPKFLAGLEDLGLAYVVEVPKSTYGWLIPPLTLAGQKPSRVDNLARCSAALQQQAWKAYRIKETGKGPVVWQTKAAPFWLARDGQVVGPYVLLVARNTLDKAEVKYFVAKAPAGTPRTQLLHVGFQRAPVERLLADAKGEVGLSHYEGRTYQGMLRHCYLTQVSHLFLSRATQQLRGKKSGGHGLSGAGGGRRAGVAVVAGAAGSAAPPLP